MVQVIFGIVMGRRKRRRRIREEQKETTATLHHNSPPFSTTQKGRCLIVVTFQGYVVHHPRDWVIFCLAPFFFGGGAAFLLLLYKRGLGGIRGNSRGRGMIIKRVGGDGVYPPHDKKEEEETIETKLQSRNMHLRVELE